MFEPNPSVVITADNYATASLDDWQAAFWNLYGPADSRFPLYDMMLQLVGDSTSLAEAVRKHNYTETFPIIPRIFSWLSTMVSKVAVQNAELHLDDLGDGKRLSEMIWNKYPRICYLCGEDRCLCVLTDVDRRKDYNEDGSLKTSAQKQHARDEERALQRARIQRAQRRSSMPTALDDWVDMFDNIYGNANRPRTSSEKTFHFLEEVGEVEKELRAADRVRFGALAPRAIEWEEEIADVFSWLASVFLHVRGHMQRSNDFVVDYQKKTNVLADNSMPTLPIPKFSELLWAEFGDSKVGLRCHRCLKTRCDMTVAPPGAVAVDNRPTAPDRFIPIPPRR